MPVPILLLALFSVALSGFAQVAFKLGVSAPAARTAFADGSPLLVAQALALSPGVIGGLAMYGVGTLVWLNVLARTPLSLAYPFVGLSFVITGAVGYLLFDEAVSPTRMIGTALVIAGVVLVGRG
ncbi:MAG: permease of the drug/metabolite transporter [Phenylobacterium sp.]|nr:permease of the drug/metabolite transporter [Phenylobacterium sp.]